MTYISVLNNTQQAGIEHFSRGLTYFSMCPCLPTTAHQQAVDINSYLFSTNCTQQMQKPENLAYSLHKICIYLCRHQIPIFRILIADADVSILLILIPNSLFANNRHLSHIFLSEQKGEDELHNNKRGKITKRVRKRWERRQGMGSRSNK